MGGIIIPGTTIHGGIANPGIPFSDSPSGGFYELANGGLGVSISGLQCLTINANSLTLGRKLGYTYSLSTVGNYGATAGGDGLAMSPNGLLLAVANNTNGVSLYSVNPYSGAVSHLADYTIASDGPYDLAFSPDGAFLLLSNSNNSLLIIYSVNATTGVLTQVNTTAISFNNRLMRVSPDGAFVYWTQNGGTVSVMPRNTTTGAVGAEIQNIAAGAANNYGTLAVTNNGVFVGGGASDVKSFVRNPVTGLLTLASNNFVLTGTPTGVIASVDGSHLYVANSAGKIDCLNIASNQTLSTMIGSPLALASAAAMAVSSDGQYLYVTGNATLEAYTLDATTGLPSSFQSTVITAGTMKGAFVSLDGTHIFNLNVTSNVITVCRTTSTPSIPLLQAYYDQTGGANGVLLVNGQAVLNKVQIGASYAALNGAIAQPFNAKSLTLDHAAGGLIGTPAADNAIAGAVGEYIQDVVPTPGVALATGVVSNVGSIALTPGDWDVDGTVDFLPAATTSLTELIFGLSTATGALGGQDTFGQLSSAAEVPGANLIVQRTPTVRISIAANTTVYLVAEGVFTVSTLNAFGTIRARRVR